MHKIKYFILQYIFPGFYATFANKIILENYSKQTSFDVDLSEITFQAIDSSNLQNINNQTNTQFTQYIEQLKTDLKEQHDRKKIIEDKAKSLLFIITVSITAITFSLNYLNSIVINIYQIIAIIVLGLSILYFASGTIRALQTLNIRQFNVIQAEVKVIDDSFKLSKKQSDEDFLKQLIKSKQLNDLINIRLSNYTYASFNLIRNGILLFVMFFITTVCINYISKNNRTRETHGVKKEIQVKINDSINVNIPYTFEIQYDIKNLEIDKNAE